MKVREGSVLN